MKCIKGIFKIIDIEDVAVADFFASKAQSDYRRVLLYDLAINSPTLVKLKVEAFWSRSQARFLGEPSDKLINESAAAVPQLRKKKTPTIIAEVSVEYELLFTLEYLMMCPFVAMPHCRVVSSCRSRKYR